MAQLRRKSIAVFTLCVAAVCLIVATASGAPIADPPGGDAAAVSQPRAAASVALPSDAAARALHRSQAAPSSRIVIVRDAAGVPQWVSGSFRSALAQGIAVSPTEAALRFLARNRALFGLANPRAELAAAGLQRDAQGVQHAHFTQLLNRLPIWNAGLSVHFGRDGRIGVISGNVVPSELVGELRTSPAITAGAAAAVAAARVRTTSGGLTGAGGVSVKRGDGGTASDMPAGPRVEVAVATRSTQLGYVLQASGVPRLAYRVRVETTTSTGEWAVIVDAMNGRVLAAYDQLRTALYGPKVSRGRDLRGKLVSLRTYRDRADRRIKLINTTKYMRTHRRSLHPYTKWEGCIEVRTAGHRVASDGSAIERANFPTVHDPNRDNLFTDRAAVSLAGALNVSYNTFFKRFGRNSLDGNGLAVIGNVHLGRKYENAYWSPWKKMMFFGDNDPAYGSPYPKSNDVVAHEFTHGVTNFAVHGADGGFQYLGQSGAIDEAYSDIFACVADWGDWYMGEDLGAPMRYLANPMQYDQPASMLDYYSMPIELDNGGVHYNNSVLSHALYRAAMDPRTGVQLPAADGRVAAARIFYQAYYYLASSPTASIKVAAQALVQAARDIDAASGSGTTAETVITEALNYVGALHSQVLGYDDGSVLDGAGNPQYWEIYPVGTSSDDYISMRFDRPSSGGLLTVSLPMFEPGLLDGAGSRTITGDLGVWLMSSNTSGYPEAVVATVYTGSAAGLRWDGVSNNFILPTAIPASSLPPSFHIVVGYEPGADTQANPHLFMDSGAAPQGRSYYYSGYHGQWFNVAESGYWSAAPNNFMIRAIWSD